MQVRINTLGVRPQSIDSFHTGSSSPLRRALSLLLPFAAMAIAGMACPAPLSAQNWTLHGPQSRHSHSAVFDPVTQKMILFGGQASIVNTDLNDVWLGQTAASQNDSFTQLLPSGTPPPARFGQVATYDSASNAMTIFAGAEGNPAPCGNDVWILQAANGQQGTPQWVQITPAAPAPAPRVYSSGAYDPDTNTLIIFGGNNCSTGYFNDVWVLSNANGQGGTAVWKQMNPSGTPPAARQSASAVYDSSDNILTIYAGDSGGTTGMSDVWVLSNANGNAGPPAWTQLFPSGTAPKARTGQTATYNPGNNRMTIFGGQSGTVSLSDSWVLSAANGQGSSAWLSIPTQGTAPSLAYHSAVYDSVANNMYVFGGSSSASKLQINDHAFTLTEADGLGTGKWFLGGPPVRYGQSTFYDSGSDSLFVFGGQHAATNLNFNDFWQASDVIASSNLQWTSIASNGSHPAARFGHTGLYDSGSNRFMLFGGATGFPAPCANDYHVLSTANNQGVKPNWKTIVPSGAIPAARLHQASVYVSGSNQIVIFGGNNCSTTYFNDVWILSDANDVAGTPSWAQLAIGGPGPAARQSASAVYDATTNSLIVYGGDAGGTPFNDLWILSNADGAGGASAWTQLTPANSGPGARSGHTATYDSVNNIMTVYAGYNGGVILSDAWTLSNANGTGGQALWTQLPANQPRRFHSSNYDAASNTMITFGGSTGTQPLNPVADIYTLSGANGLP